MEEYGYNQISESWKNILKCEGVFKHLDKIYTPGKNTFRCFTLLEPEDVRVIIIGQDPYVDGDGLAFSSNKYKVANCTILNCLKRNGLLNYDKNYAPLDCWARRGALLMNSMLTTPKSQNTDKGSHKFWLEYTQRVVQYFSDKDVKFLVWGKFAASITQAVPSSKCYYYHHPTAKCGQWNFPDFDKCNFDWSIN